MQYTAQKFAQKSLLFSVWCVSVLLISCSSQKDLPRVTAQITTVYREQITLEDFTFVYWWQERGETPFLKPYTITTTDFILEVLEPLPDQPNRVLVRTRRIPLPEISSIDISLTDTGKKVIVTMKDGTLIEGTTSFPRDLRKDPKSGIADHKTYIEGKIVKEGDVKKHRQELDYITSIRILESTTHR